jgi:hypothetical protein
VAVLAQFEAGLLNLDEYRVGGAPFVGSETRIVPDSVATTKGTTTSRVGGAFFLKMLAAADSQHADR